MMTHTPGPWTVGDLINMGGYRDYYQISCSPEHGDLNIEISNPFGTELEETKANARLIAATPDLLAALERLVADVDAEEYINQTAHSTDDYDMAFAAIAKATQS